MPTYLKRTMVFAAATVTAGLLAYVVDVELICGLVVLMCYVWGEGI